MLYVVGVGPGDPELMSIKAVKTLERCDVIAGWRSVLERVLQHHPQLGVKELVFLSYKNQDDELRRLAEKSKRRDVCVLAHGDPTVSDWEFLERIRETAGDFAIVHSVSSINVALGKLGLDLAHVLFVSMHASSPQDPLEAARLAARKRALVIFPPPRPDGPVEVAKRLAPEFAKCRAWVLEELTIADRIWRGTVEELTNAEGRFSDLSIVVVDCRDA